MEFVQQLLTGNIGTVILLIILWKTGLLKYLLSMKNGNGDNSAMEELTEKVDLLATNHFHEANESLKRIENLLEKMDRRGEKISDDITYIKARTNGFHK